MKKIIKIMGLLFVILFLFITGISTVFASDGLFDIDTSKMNTTGFVTITFKDVKEQYVVSIYREQPYYNKYIVVYLDSTKNTAEISMPNKSGKYSINIYKSTKGLQTKVEGAMLQYFVDVDYDFATVDTKIYYTKSTEIFNFSRSKELLEYYKDYPAKTKEDVDAILRSMLVRFTYDDNKRSKEKELKESQWVIDNALTFKSSKGVCGDFASALATVLRSKGIMCRMALGYADKIKEYHAWNEFYIGTDMYVFDLTVASAFGDLKSGYVPAKEYKVTKYYQ